MKNSFSIKGNLLDLHQQRIYPALVEVEEDRIIGIQELKEVDEAESNFILPGFIDAHVHIESSMLLPSEFARLAVVHGTVATVSDPHEIANVCGIDGVEFMIANGKKVPFKFNFGAPSCVPATVFETAGASIDAKQTETLLRREDILYLSEMMNFPGVLHGDEEVMKKIAAAKKFNKPVDGHAPGLRGEEAKKYIDAGISTDHECFTEEEARDKLEKGMNIIIREGSAARNFEALVMLLQQYPEKMMFCSDDKHPDSLVEGHINQLCARAIAKGIPVFSVLQAACVNPVNHYKLKVGLLRKNDFADFIVVKDLKSFEVVQTYINGQLVAEGGKTLITRQKSSAINHFQCEKIDASDLRYTGTGENELMVMEALDGQLITNKLTVPAQSLKNSEGWMVSNVQKDILKIVVVNRYAPAKPAVAFVKNFGLKKGAIASSVAHDSHNIVAVGVGDEEISRAINLVIEEEGGISCVDEKNIFVLPLTVAGLMSDEDGYSVAENYSALDQAAKDLGSSLSAPFMTLSFMALLVIPHLKLSDLGLFDGDRFAFAEGKVRGKASSC
ncbi:MAG: adenine deaminase [Flavisolibacter sp.]